MDRNNALIFSGVSLSFRTFFLSDLKDVIPWTFRLLPDSSLLLMQHRMSPDRVLQERYSFVPLDFEQPLSCEWILGCSSCRTHSQLKSHSLSCVIVMTSPSMASELRGHHCLWFVDNIASLMSLIRGRSSWMPIVHSMLCGLQCMIYWEWVASADNWSDGVSRKGSSDPWLRQHSFTPFLVDPLLLLFQLSPSFIIRIFSFL